jgi:hypothetical protein
LQLDEAFTRYLRVHMVRPEPALAEISASLHHSREKLRSVLRSHNAELDHGVTITLIASRSFIAL